MFAESLGCGVSFAGLHVDELGRVAKTEICISAVSKIGSLLGSFL